MGSLDEIAEKLISRREQYGISYITVGRNSLDEFAPVVAKMAGT